MSAPDRCRFVLGDVERGRDVRYCPRPVARGSSYCLEHRQRCHRPMTPGERARLERLAVLPAPRR